MSESRIVRAIEHKLVDKRVCAILSTIVAEIRAEALAVAESSLGPACQPGGIMAAHLLGEASGLQRALAIIDKHSPPAA